MGARTPGPVGASTSHRDRNDGTLAPAGSPLPGPVGTTSTARVKAVAKPRAPLPRRGPKSALALAALRRGAQGPEVQKLQRQLNARLLPAPKLAVDGVFGPLTYRAVVAYQKAMHIEADGIVGKLTWYHLLKGDKATVPQFAPAAAHAATAVAAAAVLPKAPVVPVKPGVWEWPLEEKFAEALRRTAPKLDDSLRDEFLAMLTPAALAMMAGTLVVWAASHAFGVGEVIDVILLVAGAVFLGMAVFDVADDMADFLVITCGASSEQELEQASSHLAKVIGVLGVATFMALLAKVGAKARAPKMKAPETAPRPTTQTSGRQTTSKETAKSREQLETKARVASKKLSKEELSDWYKKQGKPFDNPEILEKHIKGTDLKKPIYLQSLDENTELIQYVRVDGKPGMYFARPGTPMGTLGIKPPPERVMKKFIVKKRIDVVESTAASIEDGLAPGVGGMGGGQQLMLPKGWETSVVPL